MSCAWREIASYADVAWLPLLIVVHTAFFTAAFVLEYTLFP
jgi:hypothetical protein